MSKFAVNKMRCAVLIQVIAAVLCVWSSLGDGAINYCGAKMCAHTDTHTFCQYPPGPDPSCVGYMDARLSGEEKARVLSRLNRRRSEVARGVRGLPPAGDMLKLRWVEELAREAQRWADQCQPPSTPEYYDGCRDLYSITVGQCVASVLGEAPGLRCETMVDVWHMQSRLYAGLVTNYTPPENTNNYYGDFAQMVWSRAYMVGCGRSRFMTPWHGRLRSVERLVCNFAPRGPAPQRAMWTPGPPTSACPARSHPDTERPELCAYHYIMDETYDEDNTMSLEEHLLLNTILEIEKNASLDYIGSIDEHYLTKLAVATIENPIGTSPSYSSNVQKRNIFEQKYIESRPIQSQNESYFETQKNGMIESTFKLKPKHKSLKRKEFIIGRPKTYEIDEMNDIKINNYDKPQKTTTEERDINYDDYDVVAIQEQSATATTVLKETRISNTETITSQKEEFSLNTTTDPKVVIQTITYTALPQNTAFSISIEAFGMFLNDMISNLSIPDILNESAIDANVLDDYLSDPETVRQLQEALDRMEKKAASTPSTSGKVRRELRNLQHTDDKSLQSHDQKGYKNLKGMKPGDLSEIERNKTMDRGPMLNMVLKYMPYLKPYEKSIIGYPNVNSGTVISPSFILFVILYI